MGIAPETDDSDGASGATTSTSATSSTTTTLSTDTSGAFVTRQRLQEEYIRYGFSLLCYVSWITTDVASITMVVLACFLAHPYPKDYWCLGFCNIVWESLAYTVLPVYVSDSIEMTLSIKRGFPIRYFILLTSNWLVLVVMVAVSLVNAALLIWS